MVKTDEREKHFIFSKPSSLYMGLRLYSKTDLHLSHSIDLAQFLANHPLTKLGMIKGQRYGDAIDTQLNNISQDQINYISVDKALKLAMFNQGDVDYIIEYSEDIAIAWPQISKEKLYSYKIKNSDKYVLGHMMCSKTNSGAKFIDAYNLALQNLTHSKVFFDIQYSTISEDSQADFIQYFDDVFKE